MSDSNSATYQVIECPWCHGRATTCDQCRGRRRVLCFPFVEIGPGEELRLFRVRYLGRAEALPLLEFADEEE